MKPLVIVSFYDRRSLDPLRELLKTFREHPAGCDHEVLLVVNSTSDMRLPTDIALAVDHIVYRPNLGMNIGAWHAGWREFPGRPFYLFLQDECVVIKANWLSDFKARLEGGAGLVGESINEAWNKPWSELRETMGRNVLPEHLLAGEPANRVDVYLDFMSRHGIDPGRRGLHVRALVWAAQDRLLTRLGGFPQGANYGECIAAEIGVSRQVESLGDSIDQLRPQPFHAIRHREWNQDIPGGRWSHKPMWLSENGRLKERIAVLEAQANAGSKPAKWRRLWLPRGEK